MPTREQLESALRNAHAAGDEGAAKKLANELRGRQQETPAQDFAQGAGQGAMMVDSASDIANVGLEAAAGVNRGVANLIDFFGTDTANAIISGGAKAINSALELTGTEERVPVVEGAIPRLSESIPGIQGGFMEEGLARDVVGAAGEVIPSAVGMGGAIRYAAKALPAAASQAGTLGAAKEYGQIALREAAKSGVASDVGYGAVSAAGSELGEAAGGGETGALVGSILAPMAAATGTQAIRGLLSKGGEGVSALVRGMDDISEEGAGAMLAEAMAREGMEPDDVANAIKSMGPDAIPADIGETFGRLLKVASNKLPGIEGSAKALLNERQAGQASRFMSSLDDGTGTTLMNVDDEIARLNVAMKPEIDKIYSDMSKKPFYITGDLKKLLDSKSSIGRAWKASEGVLDDMRAIGKGLQT